MISKPKWGSTNYFVPSLFLIEGFSLTFMLFFFALDTMFLASVMSKT